MPSRLYLRNYNESMIAVRYIALLALVVWLGSMIALGFSSTHRGFHVVGYACGGLIVLCMLVMKFVGPPPRAFVPRVTIAAVMLAIAFYTGVRMPRGAGGLITINVALGAVLLFWYVRE